MYINCNVSDNRVFIIIFIIRILLNKPITFNNPLQGSINIFMNIKRFSVIFTIILF